MKKVIKFVFISFILVLLGISIGYGLDFFKNKVLFTFNKFEVSYDIEKKIEINKSNDEISVDAKYSDKNTVTLSISGYKSKGDSAKITFYVVNNGNIDAKVTAKVSGSIAKSKYYDISTELENDGIISKKSIIKVTLSISLINNFESLSDSKDGNISLKLNVSSN